MYKKPRFTAQDISPYYSDLNCYEYFLACTHKFKEDYPMIQFKFTDHMRSEILADIDSLACYFKEELGLQEGDAFSLFTPNTVEEIIIFFALNKLGCIANMIHPLFPSEAMRASVEYTKSKGILILDKFISLHADTLKEMNIPVVVTTATLYAAPVVKKPFVQLDAQLMQTAEGKFAYDFFGDILKKYAGRTIEGPERSGDLTAVYMNGGGTTGVSRTIMLSGTALNAVAYNTLGEIYPNKYDPGVACKIATLPFFHAFGLCAGLLSTVYNGAKCIPMVRFEADEYIEILKKNTCFEIVGVPNMFRKLLDHPEFPGEHLKSVEYAFSGGDYVPIDFLTRFNSIMAENGSVGTLMPGYGLTECGAVDVCNLPWATKAGTVGVPLGKNRVAVFDDDKNKLPCGELGEIGITGESIMQGYLMPDGRAGEGIYVDAEGTKWVLTGDMGTMDEDNFVTFAARKKRLIIISGYNVFPADIENLLEPLDFLKETCAVQGYDDEKKPIVRLYIVLSETADEENLEEYKKIITDLCSETLTVFSIPRDIRVIDALPRTRLEKVDFLKLTEIRTEEHKT
ncbi:MAG: acyl--CoA ligase [Ruminococcaceae bacterium]|nr:acyl--CoA ligase [Oscillospiraceae bacterium]